MRRVSAPLPLHRDRRMQWNCFSRLTLYAALPQKIALSEGVLAAPTFAAYRSGKKLDVRTVWSCPCAALLMCTSQPPVGVRALSPACVLSLPQSFSGALPQKLVELIETHKVSCSGRPTASLAVLPSAFRARVDPTVIRHTSFSMLPQGKKKSTAGLSLLMFLAGAPRSWRPGTAVHFVPRRAIRSGRGPETPVPARPGNSYRRWRRVYVQGGDPEDTEGG